MTDRAFGLVIAYAIPGFVLVLGLGQVVPEVQVWLYGLDEIGPTVAGFLFSSMSSIAAGLVTSAVRWAAVDTLMHASGLRSPRWSQPDLHERIGMIQFLVDAHYRYYQFYANTAVAGTLALAMHAMATPTYTHHDWGLLASGAVLIVILLFAARDALSKYYHRTLTALETNPPASPPTA